jgi:regulator of sirC expression with transglutaminase-like and TPR domain
MEGGAALRTRLARLATASDEELNLGEVALMVAALDRTAPSASAAPGASPGDPIAYYLDRLTELGADVRSACADGDGSAPSVATALAETLFRRHRFRPDDRDDDDTSNANLMWVLEHRRGTADALGLLALEVGRRAGLLAEGLAFPAHLLVRLEDAGGRRLILDPFAGGRVLSPPEMRALLKAQSGLAAELEPALYAPVANRDILIRLNNEVKLRLLRCGRIDRAVGVVETMLLFAPDRALLWREAGLMHMRLDNLGAAVAALEQFVARTTNIQAKSRTQALLAELKNRLN